MSPSAPSLSHTEVGSQRAAVMYVLGMQEPLQHTSRFCLGVAYLKAVIPERTW